LSINSSTGELSGTPPANSAGTYTFTVTVDDGQQTASKQFDLTVNVQLVADFEANPTSGKAPLDVTFTDKSTGNPTSWEWDFDNDGNVDSTVQNPTHTYSNPGWYTVKLTVSDGATSDTCVKERYILVYSNVYYVDWVNGDDAKSGTTWSDAWKTIGHALSVAGDYDFVLVADATYNETNLDFGGKKIYLKGVDHNTAGQRPVIDCQSSGRAFYFGSGETKDCVIDNFAIQNGKVEDTYGGAIVCENNSSPTIRSCVFENNKTEDTNGTDDNENGGAIYCYDNSSPTLMNCTFSGNGATGGYSYGGAIYCYDNCSLTVMNCTFSGNSATWDGGAIWCYSSNPTITGCTFSGNSAGQSGGAIYCYYSGPTIRNCVFSSNYAPAEGGAIACNANSSPTVTNCTFNGNSARQYGGAIACVNFSSPTITNCAFSSNSVIFNGGVLHCYDSSSPTLTNCTFSGNSASGWGGVIWCTSSSNPTLNNSVLWGDSASYGGSNEIAADSGCTVTLNYCCVDNTGYGGNGTIDDSNNCIHDDPQFVDAANGNYHLKPTSPCIDAGNNSYVPSGVTTDLDGNQRVVDGGSGNAVVDIGAYEFCNIIYVDGTSGDDANDGLSWGKAKKTIQGGIDAASDRWLVLVADGTSGNKDIDFGGKKIYLKGVDHNTAGARPVIDCQSNGRAFYFHSGETKDCVIDNFTIQNGKVEDTYGGAIACRNSSPTIRNCVFQNNKAVDTNGVGDDEDGGAIFCEFHSSPTIINCTFSGNSAEYGGAIRCDIFGSPTVTNCTFSNNSAGYGGAIACHSSSSPSIINCVFSNNSATRGYDGGGGGIYCNCSNPSVTNCTFSGNEAVNGYGGAIFCYSSSPTLTNCTFGSNSAHDFGGAIYCYYSSSPSIVNCTFSSNSADDRGGAIYCKKNSSPSVTNCTFSNNSASYYGGAIYCNSSNPVLTNCVFSGNIANNDGGAIYCCDSSNLTVTNCTLSDNSATNFFGGAIECYSNSSATLNNCILWGDSASAGGGEVYADSGCTVTLNYCCVDNTGYGGSGTIDDSNNCIHDDPQFVDAANGDYHLKSTSPCIDEGNNSLVPSGVDKDLDGNQRVVDGGSGTAVVDIGAYEYQP